MGIQSVVFPSHEFLSDNNHCCLSAVHMESLVDKCAVRARDSIWTSNISVGFFREDSLTTSPYTL